MSVTEIAPGVYRIEEDDDGRRLCQFVVTGSERALVLDAGLPRSPPRGVLPLLASLGNPPVVVVLTHPDADHRGGAPVLGDALPAVELWGHALDAAELEDPQLTLSQRYLRYQATDGIGPDERALERMRRRLGRPLTLDRRLDADTTLDLGSRRIELLHTPGHSPGSVTAWLPGERLALIGDAAMGRGIRRYDGSVLYAPMFSPPSAYLYTLERLEALDPAGVLASHEPPMDRDTARRFLEASREAAQLIARLVEEHLGASGVTLRQVCSTVGERYGELDAVAGTSLAMAVDGVLAELLECGDAAVEPGPPRTFRRIQ